MARKMADTPISQPGNKPYISNGYATGLASLCHMARRF
jgi:hypothetical protein